MKGTPTSYRPKKRSADKVIPAREILEIAASIARKHLDLHQVAAKARVNYAVVSGILSGGITRPRHIPAIRHAVASFPTP
jgi:hypothetical protein